MVVNSYFHNLMIDGSKLYAKPFEGDLIEFLSQFYYDYKADDFLILPQDNDYGFDWPDGTFQLTKELYGFLVGGIGGLRKFDHLIRAIRLQWPDKIEFVSKGILNTNLMRVLWACCYEKDLGIAGAASAGKTFPVAAYILIDWMAAPSRTLTFVCTTSLQASDDRIWGTIVSLYKEAIVKYGTLIDYKKAIVFGGIEETSASEREYKCAIKALAIEAGLEGQKAIDTTRGRKNGRVRLWFDELPEMGTYVTKARVNLSANPDFQCGGIGNPNRPTDAHGELLKPDHPDGFQSINENTPEWKTRTGKAIFLSGRWSPNFLVNEKEPIPFIYMTNHEMLERMRVLCYGNVESVEYRRNAIGFWPTGKNEQTILSTMLIRAYGADKIPTLGNVKRTAVSGLDLGFSVGGDECVGQFADIAEDFNGRKVLIPTHTRVYMPLDGEVFEKSIAKQYVDDCIRFNVKPSGVGLDISADGGKVAQEIIKYWLDDPGLKAAGTNSPDAYNIVAISSMGKASERIVSDIDRVPCSVRYDRRVTEYWFNVRTGVLSGVIKGMDLESAYVSQFCLRLYWKQRDKLYIETKDDMKLRLGGSEGHSPDHADGFAYMVEMALRNGLEFVTEARWQERMINVRRDNARRRHGSSFSLVNEKIGSYSSNSWGEPDC